MSATPASLNFGGQLVGTTASQTVTVMNTGNANLSITQVSITPSQFQLQPSPSLPISLSPGLSMKFTISFTPDQAQLFTGTLTVTSNASTSPSTIPLSGAGATTSGTGTLGASPVAIDFGNQVTGTSSPGVTVTATNNGTGPVTIASVTTAAPFAVSGFSGSAVLNPGQQLPLSVTFAPSSAGGAAGTLSITSTASSTATTVGLSGTGTTTAGNFSITPAAISFGNQAVGSSSPTTMVTFTNTGTAQISIAGVGVFGPFPGSGFSGITQLDAGTQVQFPVAFAPTTAGPATGDMGFIFSGSAPSFAALSGNGIAVTSLTLTTASPLPQATQNAPYLAVLQAAGGTAPYSWAAVPATSLPSGLTLAPSGSTATLSGSSVTAAPGDFPFVVQVIDSSSPPNIVAATLTVTVRTQTGGTCSNISSGSPPLVPLTDLGTNTFQGQQGGLYGGGSNTDPSAHQNAGVSLAQSIQPLDSNGNPDPANGKLVLVSIGMSNAFDEFKQFINDATSDPSLNAHLVVVNGAQPGFGGAAVADPNNVYWTNLIGTILPQANVTANQVVAAWVKEADAGPASNESFSQYAGALQGQLEAIAQNLHSKFPNIKLAYYAARTYGGYASTSENPEPFAYYSGFADRGAILDQINGVCSVNFDPTQCGGVVMAPWMAWGPYFWGNGMTPRSDGLVWTCQDFQADGTHPTDSGRQKVGNMLLNFFTSDPTSTPWFLAH